MVESYTVAARLEMTSNAAQVTAQIMGEFGRLNREIKATQESLSRFTTHMRALAGAGRGMGALTAAMEKLGKAKLGGGIMADMDRLTSATRGLETVQATLTRDAQAMATAYREAAAASRSMGGGAGGGRRGGSGGAPGAWPQAARDAYPNAQYDNANVNHVARAGEAAAAGRFRNDFALATHENAARDAAARRGRASQADMLNGAMGAQQIGGEGLSFFTKAIMAEAEVSQQLAGLRMNTTVTDADVGKARALAERIARETPGTTIAENLKTLTEAYTVMGDLKDAMIGAPAMARLSYVLKNMPGAHRGDSAYAAAQATEVMQRMYDPKTHEISMEAFNQQLAAMTQVAVGTGGRVDGSAYLAFAKQSRVGGMVANDQYLYRDLPAMLISLGGSRTGTGDAAVWSQFMSGRMTKNAFTELRGSGLIDDKATWSGGQVRDMMAHLRDSQGFGANRIQWMRDNILGDRGVLAGKGIDPNDRLAVSNFLSQWASRQTGLGFLAEGVLGMGGINKESQKIGQTTTNPMQVMAQNDPMQRMREFRAAENELMVTLGQNAIGPAMEALKGLTSVLRQLSDIGKSHPNMAGDITLIVGGVSALATAAGNAAMALFVGAPIITGLRALTGALSPFSAGGAAAGAMASLPAGLSGVGIALVALAGAVVGIPKIFEGIAGALGLRGGQDLHGGGKGSRSGITPDASGASPWGALGNLFGGPSTASPSTQGGPHTGGGRGSGTHASPSSFYARPTPPQVIQANLNVHLDGRVIAQNTSYHQSRELSGPARGMTGFDSRETPQMPGAGAVAI